MRRWSIGVLAVMAAASWGRAQELTNHALGRPYRVTPAPDEAYADADGPEAFAADAFYRGELTDGASGPANYRAAEWVGWRDVSYADPIAVEIDLGEPAWVERVEVTICGAGGNIEPPERIDLAVVSPDFPLPVPVQVAQMRATEPWEPAATRVYTYALDGLALRASRVRLHLHERTWSYLFVDEIRVLGGAAGAPGILPVQDLTVEAEAGATTGEVAQVEGTSGSVVRLDTVGEELRFELPLPAGDYTVRVRSTALEPDTFSEVVLTAGGQAMRPQAITNSVFTWQRSHFTQPEDGPAVIAISLREGAGVLLDQVRIHQLTLNETITALYPFERDTTLVANGECRCIIAIADDGRFAAQGEALAAEIARRSGARPEVVRGDEISEEHFRSTNVIALGTRASTFALVQSSPDAWRAIPSPPEDGSPQLFTDVDPRGAGVNTLVVGGVDEAQVQASVEALIARLRGERMLIAPWDPLPAPELADTREHYQQMAVESGIWIRSGDIRHLQRDWKYYPDDTFVLLGYRYLEYLDSPDTIRQVASDGFIDAETQKIVGAWDRREHHASIGRLESLQLTNLILLMARKCAGIFDWNCCQVPGEAKRYHTPEECARILAERQPTIAHNHQTFPTYSIAAAGDYFAKYYDLPEARQWQEWADLFMAGPLRTAKPMEDCWGYQDITFTDTARYAAMTGRWEWFNAPMVYQFLRLRLMSHDNMGAGVGYGDVGGYTPATGPATPETSARNWLSACGDRLDLSRADWDGLTGLYVHPMEPMYYAHYGTDSPVPLDQSFDKLSFRDAVDPQAAYLLLDGISGGYHGHWDGNSILRFTDNGRVWLCEGDYLKGDPKDHNTLTIVRDAESGLPGLFCSLQARFEGLAWASSITRTPAYSGLDWDRHIIWHRPSDTFVLFDEVTALQPGTYDAKARFRSLGETRLADRTWAVEQQGERFFLHAPGAGELVEATDPEQAPNWQAYQFVEDSTPRLLNHRVRRDLQPGERAVLPAVFYAAQAPREVALPLAEGAIALDGDLRVLAGVEGLSIEGLQIAARQFVVGVGSVLLIDGTRLATGRVLVEASAPVRLTLSPAAGTGVVEADAPATLSVLTDAATPLAIDGQAGAPGVDGLTTVTVAPGRHQLAGGFAALSAALAQAWQVGWGRAEAADQAPLPELPAAHGMEPAWTAELPATVSTLATGDLDRDGAREFVAGCEDGTLAALGGDGVERWRITLGAKINDIAIADLDGDGTPEVLCGVEDSHLHVLGADGAEGWRRYFEAHRAEGGTDGHVRVVHVADFQGDGVPEIALGCANTFFSVLDNRGQPLGNGEPWETGWRHKACAIHAADLTGDGVLELLAGWTYFSQRIVDFTKSGRARVSIVPSNISGASAIAAADVSGDGLPDAIYADADGSVTACTVAPAGEANALVHWRKTVGDDRLVAVVARDFDGDGAVEIALASHSGFVALLAADGTVQWVRYAANQVTDLIAVGD
ncbi:MAG: hypothetical protein AB7Y46_12290, partial [Armatimonadota bacterium]